jgi:hypothetical protein
MGRADRHDPRRRDRVIPPVQDGPVAGDSSVRFRWLPQNALARGVARPSAPGTFQGLSALLERLPRDFSPSNTASLRKTGRGLRRRSEAPSEAKPQVAADESGCTPGTVALPAQRHRRTPPHPCPAYSPATSQSAVQASWFRPVPRLSSV